MAGTRRFLQFALPGLVLATGLAAQSGPAPTSGLQPERFLTPDGSVFILMPRPTRGLVWWSAWFRMGSKHEGEGQSGLAAACAHATLAGTTTHGTSAPDAEKEALTALDAIRRTLRNAELTDRPDSEISALRSDYRDALARCRNLSDPLAFRRLLSAIPATPPRITCDVDGYMLESSFPSDRLDDFAVLMANRRRDAVLRGVHDLLNGARAARRQEARAPGAQHRRALLLTALEVDPLRRALIAPPTKSRYVSHDEALAFYRKHHVPGTTSTVILGDFDPARVRASLEKIYVDAKGSSATVDPGVEEPPQTGPRSKVLTSEDPRYLWAWRPPDDARTDALEALATWLQRRLETEFVNERGLAKSVRVHARFPGGSAPAPFMIELLANSAFDFRQLELAARKHLEVIEDKGVPPAELQMAALGVITDALRVWESPRRTAAMIAQRVGRHPARALPSDDNTPAAAYELSQRLFAESKRTIVTTRPPVENGEERGR